MAIREYLYTRITNNTDNHGSLQGKEGDHLYRALKPNVWLLTTILLFAYTIWDKTHTFDDHPDLVNVNPSQFAVVKRRFTGAIRAADNNTLYPVFDSNQPQYVGAYMKETNLAWDELLSGRYIKLSNHEVNVLNSDKKVPRLEPISLGEPSQQLGYYGGIDMLHNLHCLNALRRHLDPDHHSEVMTLSKDLERMHIDHCIEQLRQAILCHADTTPVTLKPVHQGDNFYLLGQTERQHTCRDSDAVLNWFRELGRQRGVILES